MMDIYNYLQKIEKINNNILNDDPSLNLLPVKIVPKKNLIRTIWNSIVNYGSIAKNDDIINNNANTSISISNMNFQEQYCCKNESFTMVREQGTSLINNKISIKNENITNEKLATKISEKSVDINILIVYLKQYLDKFESFFFISSEEDIDIENIEEDNIDIDIDIEKEEKKYIPIRFDDEFRILDVSFPYATLRDGQKYILEKLKLCDNKKYIIIEAMPGVGKSAIAHTIAYHFNSAYILTATKLLQDQYINEFPSMSIIKGKSNYMCAFNTHTPCNLAECIDQPAKIKSCRAICPHIIAKTAAIKNDVTVTSYAYFFTWLTKPNEFTPRRILICDEAHLLANQIINWATLNLHIPTLETNYHILDDYDIDLSQYSLDNLENVSDRIRSLLIIKQYKFEDGFTDNNKNYIYSIFILLQEKYKFLIDSLNLIKEVNKKEYFQSLLYESNWGLDKKNITPNTINIMKYLQQCFSLPKSQRKNLQTNNNIILPRRTAKWKQKRRTELIQLKENLTQLIDNINNFFTSIQNGNINNWLIYTSSHVSDKSPVLNIKPLYAGDIFQKYVTNFGIQHVVFMSATILSAKLFCHELGIQQNEVNIIQVDSAFDPKKSPIYYHPISDMSYKNFVDEQLKNKLIIKLTNKIKDILECHPHERGIIHTGNYNIASIIVNNIHDSRLIKKREFESNEQLLNRHQLLDNSVLVSPSLNTGADLKDDLSRFQVVVKLPFISLADKAVKTKAQIDSNWYVCDMLKTLIQSCGRSTRSEEDYSITYILDASFYSWITQYKHWLPQSFLQRIIWDTESKKN